MKQKSDIESLFNTIQEDPDNYQEITQIEAANKSLGRWSLISAVHQMDPSKEAQSLHAKADLKPTKARKPASTKNIPQSTEIEEEEIEVTAQEDLVVDQPLPAIPALETQYIKPVELNKAINALVVDTAHIKSASSESISSLFERLKRS